MCRGSFKRGSSRRQIHTLAEEMVRHGGLSQEDASHSRWRHVVTNAVGGIHGAEGFLVIESPLSLDVVAVYTAGKRAPDDAVQSIAVERVRERKVP